MKRTLFKILTLCLFAATALPAWADMSHPTGIDITPYAYQTNSFVVRNSTGTAKLTITKDGVVTFAGAMTFSAGVTFDSTATWGTSGTVDFNGTTIDLDPTAGFTLDMDASKDAVITLSDANASALLIQETANAYIDITTTNSSEAITFGNATTNPDYNFAGSGEVDVAGTVDIAGSGDIAGTLVCSKGSGTALDVSSGGELNIDGTLDCNGNADFAGNVILSGSSKTISAASLVDMNAGADVGGAGLNCSFAGNALTAPAGSDMSWLGYAAFGNGTPDKVSAGTDESVYIENNFEVDGLSYFDGAAISADTHTFAAAAEFNGILLFDNVATKTTTYNASAATTDGVLLMNTSGGAFTYTVPDEDCDAAGDVGRLIRVKCIGSCGSKVLTIDCNSDSGTATCDGANTKTISTDYGALDLYCGAADTWYIF